MTDTTTETTSEQARNSRRVLEGIVSSDAMDKSITVRVERKFKHPKYKKYIRRHSKVHVHDETRPAKKGAANCDYRWVRHTAKLLFDKCAV